MRVRGAGHLGRADPSAPGWGGREPHRPAGPSSLAGTRGIPDRASSTPEGGGDLPAVQPRQMRRPGVRPQRSARLFSVRRRRRRCHRVHDSWERLARQGVERRPAPRAVRPEPGRHTAFRVILTARRRCRGGLLGTTRRRLGPHDVAFAFTAPAASLCICHSVFVCMYLYIPGAAARRGAGPISASSRRRPAALSRARLPRSECRLAKAARSRLVTLGPSLPLARANNASCTFIHGELMFPVMYLYLTGAAAPSRLPARCRLNADGVPRSDPAHNPFRAHGRIKTEGTARGFQSLRRVLLHSCRAEVPSVL